MKSFLSIFQNTFFQIIRQPVYVVLVVLSCLAVAWTLPLSGWTMGEVGGDFHDTDQKMMENLGLSTLLVFGLLISAFTSSAAISREIEDRTALTVIAKPVPRATFVAGKFAGVTAAVALAYYLAMLTFLMVVRHKVMPAAYDDFDLPVIVFGLSAWVLAVGVSLFGNYLFGWSFTATLMGALTVLLSAAMALIAFIGKGWTVGGPDAAWGVLAGVGEIRPELLVGALLFFCGVLIFVSTAVAASTRLSAVPTLMICLAVFVAGSYHEKLFADWGQDVLVLRVLGLLVPNLTYFLTTLDTLASPTGQGFSGDLVLLTLMYGLVYSAGLFALAVGLFQDRSVQQTRTSTSLTGVVAVLAWAGRLTAVGCAAAGLILLTHLGQYADGGLMRSPTGWLLVAGLLAAGVAGWLFWGYFARGVRWTRTALLAAGALGVLGFMASSIAAISGPESLRAIGLDVQLNVVSQLAGLAVSVALLGMMFLPQTRRHFSLEGQAARGQFAAA